MVMNPSSKTLLYKLARLCGIQTVYHDVSHRRCQASVESLLAVLRSLGVDVAGLQDVPSALREKQQEFWQKMLPPVAVAWDGQPCRLQLRLPQSLSSATIACDLALETGERHRWISQATALPTLETCELEGVPYAVKLLPLPAMNYGYHRLAVELSGRSAKIMVISAPRMAYISENGEDDRAWGVFLPLYALHSEESWGGGDFSDLEKLMDWTAGMGGRMVATLPILATPPTELYEPSPYLPGSRLLWNEFYLDIGKIPELSRCPEAQESMASESFNREIGSLRKAKLVDYQRQMMLKRNVLEKLCRCFFAEVSERQDSLRRFARANPVVDDYARFMATAEKQHRPWCLWPQPLRDGNIGQNDYHEESRRYHLYVQWLCHERVQALSRKARERGMRWYLDLPLGVHPDGYDTWCHRDIFAQDISAGAPPDTVFTAGQDWLFPPLHPEKIREQGYGYIIAYLRHHLQHAGILRIDHVMQLHRLFWIPRGFGPAQGVYVRYPAEELYAILALESHRYRAIIVGEDLGTVAPEVRPAMSRHGLHRMYVLHYELAGEEGLRHRIPRHSVASLNTHDMPPFAAFWQGLDIKQRKELGLLTSQAAKKEIEQRQIIKKSLLPFLHQKNWLKKKVDSFSVFKACLAYLSDSRARFVLVNLEDLWGETQPQNVPSTRGKYPNWHRKARHSFDCFCQWPAVTGTLKLVDCLRKRSSRLKQELQ
jgi:4-alpha-glucanotransferase